MSEAEILSMCKARLDRSHTSLIDDQLIDRIRAVKEELAGKGIHLRETADDTMLLVDYVCWRYSSRDKQAGMPEWLRLAVKERWLRERREGVTGS